MPSQRGREARRSQVVKSRWVENHAAAISGFSRYKVNRIGKKVPRRLRAVQSLRAY
jgi:hypothetical protein